MSLGQLLHDRAPFEHKELQSIIATAPLRYKIYKLRKKSGRGYRTIAHPAPELKLLQSILIRDVLKLLPVHHSATGYRPGKSILDHAKPHTESDYLLKLDFKDFFPSIKEKDIALHLQRHTKISADEIRMITRILCWRNPETGTLALSIGAPSSPFISNSILYDFDSRASGISEKLDLKYTRYADDLAFSTSSPHTLHRLPSIMERVLQEIPYPQLQLNPSKTVNVSKKWRRSLVGLVITPEGSVSLGREKKRAMHAALHNALQAKLTLEELSTLRGQIAFAWSVEPSFVRSLVKKYGNGAMELLELPFVSE